MSPLDAWRTLYARTPSTKEHMAVSEELIDNNVESYDLKKARRCGMWGPTEPSDLFLRVNDSALLVYLAYYP